MRKKAKRARRLVRPADAFLPLALLLVSALGKSTIAEQVFINKLFPELFALASARGVRMAFSEQPSMRRVAGSVKLALALQFIGAFAFLVLDLIRNQGRFTMSSTVYITVGMLLNIEHVFYEYLFATGDSGSATRVRAITSALTAAGIMMTSAASGEGVLPYGLEWLLGGTALAAILAAFIGRSVGGQLKGKVTSRVLKCAPLAMVQSAVYPIAWMLALLALRPVMFDSVTAVPFFAGLTVYELARTPFRRTRMESRGFNLAVPLVALVGFLLAAIHYVPSAQAFAAQYLGRWSHEVPATGAMLFAAAVCAFGMYGNLRRD